MSFRTKTRLKNTTCDPGSHADYWCDGSYEGNAGNFPGPVIPHYIAETITYEVGGKAKKGQRPFNDCVHTKIAIQNEPQTWRCSPTVKNNYFTLLNGFQNHYMLYESELVPDGEPTQTELRSWNALAFAEMEPSLEGDISLTNFALEFSDIGRCLATLGKWRDLYHVIRRLKKRKPRDSAKKLLAETHLTYSFGIAPFVRDVKELYESLMNYRQKIDDFIARAGTPQLRHYKRPIEVNTEVVPKYVSSYVTSLLTVDRWTEFHATMKYIYTVPHQLNTLLGQLDAIRDMVGLRLTPGVVWEAIPFSFVVDWFIPIGKFLEQFHQPLVETKLTVVDYCYSTKVVARGKVERWHTGICTERYVRQPTLRSAYGVSSVYRRRKCLPESGLYFTSGTRFGATQLALSASLLLSR